MIVERAGTKLLRKHFLEHHREEEMENMEIGTRIVREYRTTFDRQIGESVEIQKNREHHHILNSKQNKIDAPFQGSQLRLETRQWTNLKSK